VRPDLIENRPLDDADRAILEEFDS
jgi:hypothetical protein